jgi:ABC-2 type transport system ATP-binding protein
VVEGLTRRYGDRTVVDHISFTVPGGTVCGFIGPNGAGKTTTIRMLLGMIRPSEGHATVLGHPLSNSERYLPRVGAMIEGPAFHPALSAARNLEVLARLGRIDLARIPVVLDLVGLGDRAGDLYRSFSLGMKQRLGIAAALLPTPELLILDEPTNGLDPDGIRDVRLLLRSLADSGLTILVSSHLLDELQQVCDSVVLVTKGKMRFSGSIENLLLGHSSTLTVRPDRPERTALLVEAIQRLGLRARVEEDDLVSIKANPEMAAAVNRAAFDAGVTLRELAAHQPRLEEVFFELTATR